MKEEESRLKRAGDRRKRGKIMIEKQNPQEQNEGRERKKKKKR